MSRISNLDLNLVKAFVAIYETKSVTRAAERLSVTQPSLSLALSKLRKVYEDQLFVRGANGLVPTTISEQLYEKFSLALTGIESTLEPRSEFDPATSNRRFRLAMSDIAAFSFTAALLQKFQSAAPSIEIEILKIADTVADDLATGKLDVVIGNLPELRSSTRSALLFRERYVCLMSAKHRLRGRTLSLGEYVNGRHLMLQTPSPGNRLIDEALAKLDVSRRVVARVPHFLGLSGLLVQSDLMVTLPLRAAAFYLNQGGLKSLELPFEIDEFDVCIHWHPRNDASKPHNWLIAAIMGTLGSASGKA